MWFYIYKWNWNTECNYFQDNKSFLDKAYTIAQAGKNLFTSRDVSKAIAKKSFKDPCRYDVVYFIINYETIQLRYQA